MDLKGKTSGDTSDEGPKLSLPPPPRVGGLPSREPGDSKKTSGTVDAASASKTSGKVQAAPQVPARGGKGPAEISGVTMQVPLLELGEEVAKASRGARAPAPPKPGPRPTPRVSKPKHGANSRPFRDGAAAGGKLKDSTLSRVRLTDTAAIRAQQQQQ